MLTDRTWKLKYTPDDGDLVRLFYEPALQDAVRCRNASRTKKETSRGSGPVALGRAIVLDVFHEKARGGAPRSDQRLHA